MNLQFRYFAKSRPSENKKRGVNSGLETKMGMDFTVHSNLPFIFQVTFVGRNDDRESVLVLDSKDLLVERGDFFEGVPGGDRIDQEEALSGAHVLLPHGAAWLSSVSPCQSMRSVDKPVFFLSCRIQDVQQGHLIVNDTLLAIRIFDCLTGLIKLAPVETETQGGESLLGHI